MNHSLRFIHRPAMISLFLVLLLIAVPIALAATVNLSGTLNPGPTYNRGAGCGSLSGTGTAVYYTTRPVTISIGGTHIFELTSGFADPYLFLYRDSFNPASPLTNCVASDDDSGVGLLPKMTATVPAGNYILVITSFSNGMSGPFSGYMSGPGIGVVISFNDGRINRFEQYAQAAIYAVDYGTGTGLHIYSIDEATGEGTLALEVTPEMIAAVPEMPAANTLIAATADGRIALYRLTTGEYQVNTGPNAEGYIDVVIFDELSPLSSYYTYRFR